MSSAKRRVVVSACLLGEYCRYDGKTKYYEGIEERFRGYEIIPFCPEAPLFGTPREKIDVVEIEEKRYIFTHETKKDVTPLLQKEIENFCKNNPKVDLIVLKSKSPSCGNGTTPILNEKGECIGYGDGMACEMMKRFYSDAIMFDESL